MEIKLPVIILSDLHVAHPASLIRSPEQVAALIPENGTVIFNGDTVEMRSRLDRDRGRENRDRLGALAAGKGTKAIFLTGNHDPYVSETHHLELWGGRVLVTHGDILFHAVSPWSHESVHIAEEHDRLLRDLSPEQQGHFETRLLTAKRASQILEKLYKAEQSAVSVARNIMMEFIPPWRPLRVFRYWKQAPGKANEMACRYRPEATLVMVGHLHHHGVWDFPGRTIVNLGCYFPFVGRLMASLSEDVVEVRRVERKGWDFFPGKVVRRFGRGTGEWE
jgi:UDP-2,3-diacylglucosamine pyrophosphatase LpxH